MPFNSFDFAVFLPVFFAGYWLLGRWLWVQNLWVVGLSYVFYGWWSQEFLLLIAFTSAWSFLYGVAEGSRWAERPSRALIALSLIVNLGILGYYKYCNFFLDALGLSAGSSLNIILPVGISFYTFQALSYCLDVYHRRIRPTRDPVAFFAFISFFPQLVAGPIERATNLLPQFLGRRTFDYPQAVMGCRQMLWGFFKKIVVADNCAQLADMYLGSAHAGNGCAAWVGIIAFSFQIYGDFSGYSDIAIGCSRLLGVRLNQNFAYPYFSRDIAEFWRKWHISLTTWFRDYLYIPLGGSRRGIWITVRNTVIVFLVSGLWHGANWTFIAWGAFHALLFMPLLVRSRNRRFLDVIANDSRLPSVVEIGQVLATFFLVTVGWTMFRAGSIQECLCWWSAMTDLRTYACLDDLPDAMDHLYLAVPLLLTVEWINRRELSGLSILPRRRCWRWLIYCALALVIVYMQPPAAGFIYFQF